MKVIDLLNKIANGEEVPKKIKLDGKIYLYSKMYEQYHHEKYDTNLLETISEYNYSGLNDEIEIIEEDKKIEKLKGVCYCNDLNDNEKFLAKNMNQLKDKVNELIDELNKLKGDKNER